MGYQSIILYTNAFNALFDALFEILYQQHMAYQHHLFLWNQIRDQERETNLLQQYTPRMIMQMQGYESDSDDPEHVDEWINLSDLDSDEDLDQ